MKKGEPTLWKELGDISYLESHPEVCQFFKDPGCYRFCEKIQGSHQQVAEAFSLSFDGSKALIGKEEFLVDETLIAEVTELPRTREKWFNTTITKNVEFRSYLKPEYRNVIWNKIVPSTWLEEIWQQLLKILVSTLLNWTIINDQKYIHLPFEKSRYLEKFKSFVCY